MSTTSLRSTSLDGVPYLSLTLTSATFLTMSERLLWDLVACHVDSESHLEILAAVLSSTI